MYKQIILALLFGGLLFSCNAKAQENGRELTGNPPTRQGNERSVLPADINKQLESNGGETYPLLDDVSTPVLSDSKHTELEKGGAFLYSDASIREHVVLDHGKRAVRLNPDVSFSEAPVNKKNCFIIMSKKDYYLYVYEIVAGDTILRARYDCAFALRKGNKTRQGDMKTPHCTREIPKFSISQICAASSWKHDFKDGRGSIKAYGDWFLRLNIGTSNRSIGIHGSTGNELSVPGRASEGCIRLADKDIRDLKEKYVTVGMKVIIKPEQEDDRPFEIKAMRRQNIQRKRHLDPKQVLSQEYIDNCKTEDFRTK